MRLVRTFKTFVHWFSLLRNGMVSPIWSIKVFSSDAPIVVFPDGIDLDVPTLKASDVKDVPGEFVADPFFIHHGGRLYMFFEVLNKSSGRGEIGLAASSDGMKWEYQRIVLRERFHLSYPQTFAVGDDIFMLPEAAETNRVLLYKAKSFPYEWELASELVDGRFLDPSIFKFEDKWWILAGSDEGNLHLFHSEKVEGPWLEHPRSPVLTNNRRFTRPGGRVIVSGSDIYRYTQDGYPYYGNSVRVFKVNKLSESDYEEVEVELVLTGTQKDGCWRKDGMHHIDQLHLNTGQWLVAVDGHKFEKSNYIAWKLGRILSKGRKRLPAEGRIAKS